MPYVIDLTGEEYPLKATITNDGEVNGNQILSATIEFNDVNKAFIRNIAELWRIVDHDDVEHVIKYCRRRGVGDKMAVDIKGVPVFFDKLDNDRIYERIDKHMTANEAFTRIFENTGFTFVLVDSFAAVDWEGFGDGETKLETFKRAIERYKCEFEIIGNTVYLRSQIGRDTSIMYRHKLNASNIVQEIDANELWTFARGYGDYGDGAGGEDWRDAKLIREYTSPLANILGIRHAPPIKNGNIKDPAFMDAQLKTLVDESLKISVSATIHDLRKQGYPYAQSQLGDRVFLIDERIGLNEEVRVVAQSITRDWKGDVVDINITFGSPSIVKRHQSSLQTAIKNITELLEGRKKLPFDVLDNAVMEATKALTRMQTQLQITENGSLLAVDETNPNNLVILNAAGLGVSNDGGQTFGQAITGNGIVADYIATGTLRGIYIEGVEITGSTLRSTLEDDESLVTGGRISSTGKFTRTFKDNRTAYYKTLITSGHGVYKIAILEKTDSEGRSLTTRSELESRGLYLSDKGLSTQPDNFGESKNQTGRYIDLFARETYNDGFTRSGMKIFSDSRLDIETTLDTSIILNSDSSLHLESAKSSVYIAPQRDERPGNNQWQFYVEDSSSSSTTHGVLAYGSSVSGMVTGIQFSKNANDPRITIDGHLTVEGNTTIYHLLNANPSYSVYFGVGGAELAVTNNNLANNGNPVYRPVRASDFYNSSSIMYKTNIEDLTVSGLEVIKNLQVKQYIYQYDVDKGNYNNWQVGVISELSPEIASTDLKAINVNKWLGYLTKAIQELSAENDRLKKEIDDIYLILGGD